MSSNTPNPLDQVEVPVEIRLGAVELSLQEILRVGPGSMVPLGAVSDEPVELAVSGIPYAVGDLVVVDGCFAFRVREVQGDASDGASGAPGETATAAGAPVEDGSPEGAAATSPDETPASDAPASPSGPDADPASGDA